MPASLPKLIGGPYLAPAVRPGGRVKCRRLGPCVVTGMSDAPIVWPVGRPVGRKNGRVSVLLTGDLVEAVRLESEQAVAAWWGVSLFVVWKMRKALAVPEFNEGTRQLKGEVAKDPGAVAARTEGVRRVGPDP